MKKLKNTNFVLFVFLWNLSLVVRACTKQKNWQRSADGCSGKK